MPISAKAPASRWRTGRPRVSGNNSLGIEAFKQREIPDLKLAFFTWHDAVEDQHASHTQDELAEVFFKEGFDRQKFISGGMEMLDGVARFWDGLYDDRNRRRRRRNE